MKYYIIRLCGTSFIPTSYNILINSICIFFLSLNLCMNVPRAYTVVNLTHPRCGVQNSMWTIGSVLGIGIEPHLNNCYIKYKHL